jgi:DNA repair exonuclease SbcCD nuclease subunit
MKLIHLSDTHIGRGDNVLRMQHPLRDVALKPSV